MYIPTTKGKKKKKIYRIHTIYPVVLYALITLYEKPGPDMEGVAAGTRTTPDGKGMFDSAVVDDDDGANNAKPQMAIDSATNFLLKELIFRIYTRSTS
jgi:hypothetical protein